jgi:hypothetical protein
MATVVNGRRALVLLAAIAAASVALLGAVESAQASTLYACVKKNGTARLFASKPRCRHGEKRLSWNTEGVRGPRGSNGKTGKDGANGKDGTNGTNGAAGGFSASVETLRPFTEAAEVTIVSKTLPAGSYIISGKTEVSAFANQKQAFGAGCELFDGGTLDMSAFYAPLVELNSKLFVGTNTLALEAAATLKSPTTVSLRCSDRSGDKELGIEAGFSQLVAIQTAVNA